MNHINVNEHSKIIINLFGNLFIHNKGNGDEMEKILLVIIAVIGLINPAFSLDDYSDDNSNESEYKYKSSSGTKYKYDLNNPADRVRYDVDPAAKILDDINPRVRIDRNLNQYGGGADW